MVNKLRQRILQLSKEGTESKLPVLNAEKLNETGIRLEHSLRNPVLHGRAGLKVFLAKNKAQSADLNVLRLLT